MATPVDQLNVDPLAKPIPGQSLTMTPGSMPYETPPQTASVPEAFEALTQGITKPVARANISKIIDMGLSVETVVSGLTMKAFADGVITPDMAELLKPALVIFIVSIVLEDGVEDPLIFNEPPEEPMSDSEVMSLAQRIAPERYEKKKQKLLALMESRDMEDQGDQGELEEEEEEDSVVNMREGSFLDMEVPEEDSEEMDAMAMSDMREPMQEGGMEEPKEEEEEQVRGLI